MGTSGQDIHSTGTSLISLSFIVGIKRSIKRSIGRRSRLCSGFWVSAGWVSINRFSLLMEHLSLDFWTRQTLRSRVRFLRISLTFSQLSEHQSQSVILHWPSNRNLQLSGSLQKSLSLFTSVITLSTCFCSDNQSQWKSCMERVQLGFGVTRVISLPTPQILLIGRDPLRSNFSCVPLECAQA